MDSMAFLRVLTSVFLLVAGFYTACRPLTAVERRGDSQGHSSIMYYRGLYVLTTLFLIALLWWL